MRRLLLATSAAAIAFTPSAARALDFFCNPFDVCAQVPRDQGVPVYNTTDSSKPWVIGKTDVVSLQAGTYAPGKGLLGNPTVYVVEQGTVAVEELTSGDASMAAWIVLCDQATFRVRNATFRMPGTFPFQYALIAAGESRVEYENATLLAIDPSLESSAAPGAILQIMAGHSVLQTTASSGLSVQFPRQSDAWELAVVANATATVTSASMFGEFYVAGNASFSVQDSEFFDVFFEMCPQQAVDMGDLPALCEIGNSATGCFSSAHQPVTYLTSPPQTAFTLDLQNDKVFSWAASTYAGSIGSVGQVPKNGNFAVGLSMTGDQTLQLAPGNPPVFQGLTDRALTLGDSYVSFWHVWPYGSGDVELLPGSEVGDFVANDSVHAMARDSVLRYGIVSASGGGRLRLDDCEVQETFQNSGAQAWANRSSFAGVVTLAGPTWLADTPLTASNLDLRDGAQVHQVEIESPAEGESIVAGPVVVRGTVKAFDHTQTELSPFPAARLDWVDTASGSVVRTVAIAGAVSGGELATIDTAQLPSGEYELRLWFDSTDGAEAISVRHVHIESASIDAGADGGETADAGSGAEAAADSSAVVDASSGDEPEPEPASGSQPVGSGCSCGVVGRR